MLQGAEAETAWAWCVPGTKGVGAWRSGEMQTGRPRSLSRPPKDLESYSQCGGSCGRFEWSPHQVCSLKVPFRPGWMGGRRARVAAEEEVQARAEMDSTVLCTPWGGVGDRV